ncbi:MAG: threonine-phosphate decarboxylase CobD [Paracoccaceae bacterium]
MRDHGGDIDRAIERYGGDPDGWVDLSTGINRRPYPVHDLPSSAWTMLPTRAAMMSLRSAARAAYATDAAILPVAGAQMAIQMIPRLTAPGLARVLGPTYNEHAGALHAAGWQVEEVEEINALAGADLAVVVNPNNPDGRVHPPEVLLRICGRVGRLVVDESFGDPRPELSLAATARRSGVLVLRSFGKFYGLAGLRLGFVLGDDDTIAALSEMVGPWPVSGAAVEIGRAALVDREWSRTTTNRLRAEAQRLDALATSHGWEALGGCELFRLYFTGKSTEAQERLARAHIWSRVFPHSEGWLRLGLPGNEAEWRRLAKALA